MLLLRFSLFGLMAGLALFSGSRALASAAPLDLRSGDRVVFLGDTFAEREQYHGWIELMLITQFADRDISFRNLGWSADTPAGNSREGLSLVQAGHESPGEAWRQLVAQIEDAKPTVAFVAYGMASSFDGQAGLAQFKIDYGRLLDVLRKVSPGVRLVLLSPLPHESLGDPWPNPDRHNAQLADYTRAVGEIASENNALFVSLSDVLPNRGSDAPKLTENGIHLTSEGYRIVAQAIETQLFSGPTTPAWQTSEQTEALRQAILRKNEWFFHRSRPANMAYIFGFRKREQGRNATEVLQFDRFIAAEESRIAQLRGLKPVSVPEIPRRTGNLNAVFTPQPHPNFEVAEGFEVTLWAENPLLHKPVQMNFDARGRLWVASSELYPQIEPGQAATDQIIILEDPTGAGRADRATVFADGLVIPTGLEIGDDGVYVAQSTELLHFQDTDGDGKADRRRIVLSGFGTEDTHHNLHTLRWGPDGRLYMNQAVYTRTSIETPHGVVRLEAGGVFRFDPRDQRMEILYRGWVNPWGHQFDDFGQSFVTDGAGNRGISWGLPGATAQTLAPARRVLESISPGDYPKFCGLEIVRSPAFPADWQGDVITCDFRAHRVVRFKIADQGAGYVTTEMPDVIRTTADTFRPIDARFGPDGALYIADWSNPIIQHGEVDFRDPRRDKSHGRIWRIAAKGTSVRAPVDFGNLSNADLLERLLSPSGYDQEHARRVLVERGASKVLPDLKTWTALPSAQSDKARLHALWLYQAFNHSEPALLQQLLSAQDPRIRAAAVRAIPAGDNLEELAKRVNDANPRVRAEAVRALGKRPSARAAELALSVLSKPMDPFLDYALWLTINEVAEPWLTALEDGNWKPEGRERQLEFGLNAIEPALATAVLGQLIAKSGIPRDGAGPWIELIGTAGGPSELRALLDRILAREFTAPAATRALQALTNAARLRQMKPTGALDGLAPWLHAANEDHRLAALELAGAWKLSALIPQLVAMAGNAAASSEERSAAFAALRGIGGASVIDALKKLADGSPAEIRRDAIITLASLDLAAAMPEVVTLLQIQTNEAQGESLWRKLLSIQGVSARLTAELPDVKLSAAMAQAGLRPAREGTQHQSLVPILLEKAGLTLAGGQLTSAEMQQTAAEALAQGDARRGELIYRRAELACMACHAIGGAGGRLGPDLTSIGASAPPDYLVESLFYPSAKIKEGFHSALITTKDGRELNGMITRETETEVILRDAANAVTSIPVNAITKRSSVGSLMPAGLLDALLPEDRLDLIKFLTQLGKPGDYDASQGGVARVWQLYAMTSHNAPIGVERVVQGDLTLASWKPALSLVNGTLPVSVIATVDVDRQSTRGLYAATRFVSAKGGPVELTLKGQVKEVWLNGRPTRSGKQFTADAVPGENIIVLQLHQGRERSPVRLSATGATFIVE